MIFSINKKILGEAVNTVSRFAERRVLSLPALSGIAFSSKGNDLILRATNLETGIELSIEGTIKEQGTVAIPAAIFRDITGSFSGDGVVTLEQDGDVVVLSTEKGRNSIKTVPYDDIPTLGVPQSPKTTFTISGALIRSLIGAVSNYASSSTVRPELASVLLSAEGGVIKAVATDSFRLAEKKISSQTTIPPFSILIPAKNAADIMQIIPDTEIQVQADEHQCAFSWKGGVAVTRLVAMTYPDYRQIIPKTFTAEATVLKKDFESALKRTAVFSDAVQKVRLTIDPKEKNISLSATNPDIGTANEEINASTAGETLELSFNHRYLGSALQNITSESMSLSAAGIGRPLIMQGAGDTSFLYLVMPMNQ